MVEAFTAGKILLFLISGFIWICVSEMDKRR